jgi:hypothetical protein
MTYDMDAHPSRRQISLNLSKRRPIVKTPFLALSQHANLPSLPCKEHFLPVTVTYPTCTDKHLDSSLRLWRRSDCNVRFIWSIQ